MTSTFKAFLEPELDRPAFISAWLSARDIPNAVAELSGRRHVVVRFGSSAYNPRFRMKTVVAHHDRAPNTPGANDNSAACFQLMLFALRLAGSAATHNVRLVFTDGEEAAGIAGVAGQGSYAIGSALRARSEDLGDVFVLDCSGRGDTLVLSTAGLDSVKNRALALGMGRLHERARLLARDAARERWIALPTPYSDNAGFIAAGIPAQVITVLPAAEATALLSTISNTGSASDALRERIARNARDTENSEDGVADAGFPQTWKLMHTAEDAANTLTAPAFRIARVFLDAVARAMETD